MHTVQYRNVQRRSKKTGPFNIQRVMICKGLWVPGMFIFVTNSQRYAVKDVDSMRLATAEMDLPRHDVQKPVRKHKETQFQGSHFAQVIYFVWFSLQQSWLALCSNFLSCGQPPSQFLFLGAPLWHHHHGFRGRVVWSCAGGSGKNGWQDEGLQRPDPWSRKTDGSIRCQKVTGCH